jgi:hypothetical protein
VGFRLGLDELSVAWYPNARGMIRGLEKNTFGPLCGYSYVRLALLVLIAFPFMFAPFIALASGIWWLQLFGLAAVLSMPLGLLGLHRAMKMDALPSICAPLGHAILLYTVVRAGMLCAKQGGIRWRGTLYPVDELKTARRVDLTSGRVRSTRP